MTSHGKSAARQIEPVAEGEIVLPLPVALIIEKTGLDLDDQNVAAARQGHHVGAPAIGKRQLGDDGEAERAETPADAPLQLSRDRRLAPVERYDGVVTSGTVVPQRKVSSEIKFPSHSCASLTIPPAGTSC
jgi:hypothetical protein